MCAAHVMGSVDRFRNHTSLNTVNTLLLGKEQLFCIQNAWLPPPFLQENCSYFGLKCAGKMQIFILRKNTGISCRKNAGFYFRQNAGISD